MPPDAVTCHDCQRPILDRGYPIPRSKARRCAKCHEDNVRAEIRGEAHFGPIKTIRRKLKDGTSAGSGAS